MNELSRCPFCEVVAAKSTLIARPYWHKKNGCLLSGQHFTEEEWQTRPLEDALQKRIDELEAEIDRVAPFLAIHGVTGYKIVEEK